MNGHLCSFRVALALAVTSALALTACGASKSKRQTDDPDGQGILSGPDADLDPSDSDSDSDSEGEGEESTLPTPGDEPEPVNPKDCDQALRDPQALRCPCYTPIDSSKTCYRPVGEECILCTLNAADSSCPLQDPVTNYSVECTEDRTDVFYCWAGPECGPVWPH